MTGSEIQDEAIDGATARRYLIVQEQLNPRLWAKHNRLRLEVRIRLMRAALAFYRFLESPIRVSDIVLTGSNAAYNWTDLSDIDLHLVADFNRAPCRNLVSGFCNAKRLLWNQTHTVTLRGHAVEVYVEDADDRAKSKGVYSVLRGHWVTAPTQTETPDIHDGAVVTKASRLASEIETLLATSPGPQEIDTMLQRLYRLRAQGLADPAGEFSTENLAFKTLRNLGYLDRLRQTRIDAEDQDLTLEDARPVRGALAQQASPGFPLFSSRSRP